jgi:hypothetical protein
MISEAELGTCGFTYSLDCWVWFSCLVGVGCRGMVTRRSRIRRNSKRA